MYCLGDMYQIPNLCRFAASGFEDFINHGVCDLGWETLIEDFCHAIRLASSTTGLPLDEIRDTMAMVIESHIGELVQFPAFLACLENAEGRLLSQTLVKVGRLRNVQKKYHEGGS